MVTKIRYLAGVVALGLAVPAWADTTWTLAPTGSVTNGSNTETTTAWADTNGSSAPRLLEQQPYPGNFVLYTGGLGINNLDGCSSGATCDVGDLQNVAPEHAIDNDQRNEMVLLSYTQAVKLTGVTAGWTGSDADITVMAWTGAGAPPALTTATWGTLPAGWTTIGNYTSLAANSTSDQTVPIPTTVSSSYWLVGAYNSLGGKNLNQAPGVLMDSNADYVKLKSVTTKVSEPGTLALVALSIVATFFPTRRRTQT